MTLYPPTPVYSDADKRLLVLLSKLLLECIDSDAAGSNLPSGMVALTEKEADELVSSLEKLVNSREFMETCYFVEGLTLPEAMQDPRIREIYLSRRKQRGRTRLMASTHWAEFLVRLGLGRYAAWGVRASPMDFEYFQRMEQRMLSASGLHPKVIELVMDVIHSQTTRLQEIRSGERLLKHGTVKPLVADPIFRWRASRQGPQDLQISRKSVVAAITIVADASVLFTTRDWSVAGTLSTMAGTLAAASADV
jgi:hypothetical protein